jgi:hypothetical protein
MEGAAARLAAPGARPARDRGGDRGARAAGRRGIKPCPAATLPLRGRRNVRRRGAIACAVLARWRLPVWCSSQWPCIWADFGWLLAAAEACKESTLAISSIGGWAWNILAIQPAYTVDMLIEIVLGSNRNP